MVSCAVCISLERHKISKIKSQMQQLEAGFMEPAAKYETMILQSMESNLEDVLARESKMKSRILSLEQEKTVSWKTVEKICHYLPTEALSACERLLKEGDCHPNIKFVFSNKEAEGQLDEVQSSTRKSDREAGDLTITPCCLPHNRKHRE